MKNAVIKIAVCLAVIIFAVSCQEKPTEPTPTPEFTIIENSSLLGTDHHYIKVDIDNASSYLKKSANYLYIISPANENCEVTISNVSISPTSPVKNVSLTKEDFGITKIIENGVQITLTLSLTQTGIDKLKQANVQKTVNIDYKLVLNFNSNGVNKTQNIDISIMPIKIVTKAEVEALIKQIGTVPINANLTGATASFDFSQFTLSKTASEIIATENLADAYTCKVDDAGNAIKTRLITVLNNNTLGLKVQNNYYFDDKEFTEKNLVIIYILDIDPKYALEDSAAFITERYENGGGIKIKLTLQKYQWSRNNN